MSHGFFCSLAYAGCKLCPQDWQLHGERCYWLSEELGNWTKGMKSCENQDSQLVVLQDKKEKGRKNCLATRGLREASKVWGALMSHEFGSQIYSVNLIAMKPSMERFWEQLVTSIFQEYIKTVTGKNSLPVWIGLRSHQKVWRWVDNTPFNPKMLGTSLHEMSEGCGTLRAKDFKVNKCDAEYKWVCKKNPFLLCSMTAEYGEKSNASI
ncbi:hypothetical protein Nmel_008150 [Mimus melanotis]